MRYSIYGDKTPFLDKMTEYKYTRINYKKRFEFTDSNSESIYQQQKTYFENSNSWRDANHDFTEDLEIPGFHEGGLASIDGTFPAWMSRGYYLVACILLCELVYTFKFRTITHNKTFEFVKVFGCRPPVYQQVVNTVVLNVPSVSMSVGLPNVQMQVGGNIAMQVQVPQVSMQVDGPGMQANVTF